MYEHLADSLMLAQEGPPAPTDGAITQSPGTPGLTGSPGGAGSAGGSSAAPNSSFLLLMLVMVTFIIIFSWRGKKRDEKKRDAMLNAIRKHDRVQTIGGLIGSIVEIKTDTVILKVDESSNTRITFSRSSIQQVISSSHNGSETIAES